MTAQLVDLGLLKQGEDITVGITCQKLNPDYPGDDASNPDNIPKFVPIDLTGYTNPECEIRAQDKLTGDLLLTATPVFASDRTTGQLSFDIPYATSVLPIWNFKIAYFDLFVYDPAGKRKCVAECSFSLDPSTTRPVADR